MAAALRPLCPLILLITVYSILVLPVAARGCYKTDGSASHADKWPCDPNAETSLCCGAADYCLGSVMCLDTRSDNRLSLQGCTNSSWPDACNPICPGSSSGGYIYLQQCSSGFGTTQVCCGTDFTCCNGTDVYDLNIFTAISKAPGAASTSTSTLAALSASVTSGASRASSDSGSKNENDGESDSDDASDIASGHAKDIAVGLGVGIPLGLAVIGSLVFLGLQLKKQNKQAAGAQTQAQLETTVRQIYDQSYSGGDGGWHNQHIQPRQGFDEKQAPVPGELGGIMTAHELPDR